VALDYDNDGWQDIFVANGHVYPVVDQFQWGTSFAQQPLLFRNLANGKFERTGAAPKSGLAGAWAARGLAIGDLDNDGRLDAVMNVVDGRPALLRNVANNKSHWLGVKLAGEPKEKTPRDALGATVWLTTGKIRQRADLFSGAGYASNNEVCLHFGLGAAATADSLEVRWPNGTREIFAVTGVDRVVTVAQGKGVVRK
jgi:hypothetical protein